MKISKVSTSVAESAEKLTKMLEDKGFNVFADIDHQANAQSVDLELPASRVLIFGNPMAGTKLMQKDILMSLDLPLRIAIVEKDGATQIVHQTSADYCRDYDVEGHPVLSKVEELFDALIANL